jgi:hypothetical protein
MTELYHTTREQEPGVWKVGIIENIAIYCDTTIEKDKIYVGRKGCDGERTSKMKGTFIIGHSDNLESYEKVVYRFVNKRINLKNIKNERCINSTP